MSGPEEWGDTCSFCGCSMVAHEDGCPGVDGAIWRSRAEAAEAEVARLRGTVGAQETAIRNLRAEVETLRSVNDHVAEVQVLLHRSGIQCGADGSLLVPIRALLAERDAALRARDFAEVLVGAAQRESLAAAKARDTALRESAALAARLEKAEALLGEVSHGAFPTARIDAWLAASGPKAKESR